ncbi:MAG: hypothetical protein HQ542_04230 [Bacteroidia bacterium]|nr:hypothetical protein [Bacteroidia bacterium]
MKKLTVLLWAILLFGIALLSCSKKSQPVAATKTNTKDQTGGSSMALPPCIIYKTKADYLKYVPVSLSLDKTRVTSYPDVSDILKQGKEVYPQLLSDGFILDNRGIGPDVAFLSISYEAYVEQAKTPSADDLFQQLLDKDPLLEMYQCGNRNQYNDIVRELKQIIDSGKLSDCKKIK